MKKDYLIVADILKNRRLEQGLTLRELEEYSDVSRAEISKIERGERENINIRNLIKLCKCLEIDFIKLLEIAGYFDEEYARTYEVNVKKTTEKVFKVKARNENQALEIITNYVFNNNILDTKDDDVIDFSVQEINEEFDEDCDEIEEDYDEDCDEEEYECNENRDCKNCEYYCHICGECTFGE